MKSVFKQLKSMPKTIWILGFVSMFTDMSTEIIHALLPTYLIGTFGANMKIIGIFEGLAEATAYLIKLVSGVLSDYVGRRRIFLRLGYSLAAFAKLLLPFARSVQGVIATRVLDRIGKGMRDAPRDALIADRTPAYLRGASYGLRQTLDTIGGILGPLIAIALMLLLANNIRLIFFIATIPAFISVALLIFGLKKHIHHQPLTPEKVRFHYAKDLNKNFWWLIGVVVIATFARFGDSFLLIRAQDAGISIAWVPLVLVLINVFYALSAYPCGYFSDYLNRSFMLAGGLILLTFSHIIFAYTACPEMVMVGVALWGLHMGMTQGVFTTMVADVAPEKMRGTAFGILNFSMGIAMLLSNITAGFLWHTFGAHETFLLGSVFAVLALIALLFRIKKYAH